MVGSLAASASLLTLIVVLLVLRSMYKERLNLESRIDSVSELKLVDMTPEAEQLQLPLLERTFFPALRSMGRSLQTFAPSALKTTLTKRLGLAGLKITAEQWFGWYVVGAGCGLALSFIMALTGGKSGMDLLLLGSVLTVAGSLVPELILRQKTTRRQVSIVRALPDVLDLLTVSVKAGLGFDSALLKVTEKMKGPLPQEMGQVLHEVKMGVSRKDALKSLADRTGVKELQSFVGTIIQADQLGVSISNVLQLQSESLREHRRQVAEEKAMKAPVKMLFPLVLFIFPTLFIVLLGPAVLQIMKNIVGM